MRRAGFAVLPSGSIFDKKTENNLLRKLMPYSRAVHKDPLMDASMYLYGTNGGPDCEWTRWKELGSLNLQIRKAIEGFQARLEKELPGERLKLSGVQIRFEDINRTKTISLHVDGATYITATQALRGPGTIVYHLKNGGKGVKVIQAPPRAVTVITNEARQVMRGIPGTIHSQPFGKFAKRILMLMQFQTVQASTSQGLPPGMRWVKHLQSARLSNAKLINQAMKFLHH